MARPCIVALILSLLMGRAWAGVCEEELPGYFEQLAKAPADAELPDGENALMCAYYKLMPSPRAFAGERFASEAAMERLRQARAPYRALVERQAPRFLRSRKDANVCAAAFALGYYGSAEAYPQLIKCPGEADKAVVLAVMGDKRAVPWIIQQYWHASRSYDEEVYLNALFYLPAPESLPFLDEIIQRPVPERIKGRAAQERIARIKARARLVRDHIAQALAPK